MDVGTERRGAALYSQGNTGPGPSHDALFGVWRVLRIFGYAQCAPDSRAWYGMDFHNAIGRPRIETRCRHLSRLVRDRLRDIPALTLLTSEQEELSSGVMTFALDPARGDRGKIVKRLWNEPNMILKPAQGTYAYVPEEHVKGPQSYYIQTHIFNSEDEVEKMGGLMKKMLA